MKLTTPLIGFVLITSIVTSNLNAEPIYHPSGPNLVFGNVSNGRSVMSDANNPAAGATRYKPGEGEVNFGIFPSIGVGYEIGDADNLFTEVDNTAKKLDDSANNALDSIATNNSTVAFNQVNGTINDVNNLLSRIEQDGYAKAFTSFHAPIMPVLISSDMLGGSLVFDFNASLIARIGIIQDPINVNAGTLETTINDAITATGVTQTNGDVSVLFDGSNVNFNVSNDTTAVLKAAYPLELSLAYSRPIMPLGDGKLFAGVRGKYYKVELLRAVQRAVGNVDSENLFENITDSDRTSKSDFGLDIGAIWMTENYHLGATLTNINEPSFEYNKIGLSSYTDTATINKLNADEKYTMESQLKLEGSYYFFDKQLMVNAAVDVNAVQDPVGDEYKWMVLSAGYSPDWWFIPSIRGGLRKNSGDNALTYYTFGITAFKVNLDLAITTDDVEDDGSSMPRGIMGNIGIDIRF